MNFQIGVDMILFFIKALFWTLVIAVIILFILWNKPDVVERVVSVRLPLTWKGKKRKTTKGVCVEVQA